MGTRRTPPIIGLAGGIGSGKSTVARLLEKLGCIVSDSDALGRAALRDPKIRDQLVSWWGSSILNKEGEIDRSAVAKIVFNDADERARLEGLTHPWIEACRKAMFDSAPAGTVALVIDAPLLFEAGLDRECDAVIFVDSPPALRLERVRRARGWDAAELARRESSQLPLDVKRSRADDTVQNAGDLDALEAQVRAALERILNRVS